MKFLAGTSIKSILTIFVYTKYLSFNTKEICPIPRPLYLLQVKKLQMLEPLPCMWWNGL